MMKRVRALRSLPAIVVAALALVAALAGTAIAGPGAESSAINKKKVKKIASKQIKKAAPGLSVDNAENLGGAPAGDYQQRVRWAVVNNGGTIVEQSGGITVTGSALGANFLNFGEDVSKRAIVATQHYTGGGVGDGEIVAAPCGGGPFPQVVCTNPDANNTDHIYVETSNSAGTAEASAFYVAVIE